MKAVVAVDSNWGIGYKGRLLQLIPEDMRFFKQLTWGKTVVMGRATFESLPGQEPLKGRSNIVLSRNGSFKNDGVKVCRSTEELLKELEKFNTDEVFVIGGESVYAELLPFCSEAYVTRIEKAYTADKFFPDLDKNPEWKLLSVSDGNIYNDTRFRFCEYTRAL